MGKMYRYQDPLIKALFYCNNFMNKVNKTLIYVTITQKNDVIMWAEKPTCHDRIHVSALTRTLSPSDEDESVESCVYHTLRFGKT